MSARERAHDGDRPPQVGRWRLEERLGAGAFGSAWRARDGAGRVAVVKLLSAPPGDEIRALARVHHEAIVEALSAGSVPVPHLVMSLAPGVPLSTIHGMRTERAIQILAVLADALAACASSSIAHGDVKPANVVADPGTGRVTLVDFGLAGGAGGSPRYASPERLAGGAATPEGDVYALGLVAWELLAGALPWPGGALADRRHPVPTLPGAPPWLGRLVAGMLDPDPGRRPTAAAAADVFEANGIPLPGRSAEAVERRARTLRIDRPRIDPIVSRWLREGGTAALIGPPGSGLSRALSGAEIELAARGVPYVRMDAADRPWAAVEAALLDPALHGPRHPPPEGPRSAHGGRGGR